MTDKIIAIGDIHGQKLWENITARHKDPTIVFLGDYCDPYDTAIDDDATIANLEKIISFKKENPERTVLLLGNHDLHYFEKRAKTGARFNKNICMELMLIFKENKELFQYVWQHGNIIFSHAGISAKWFVHEFKGDISENIEKQITDPARFGNDAEALFSCGPARGGDDFFGGIFWADYKETMNDYLPGIIQVVGHSRVREIFMKRKTDDKTYTGGIIYCDCLQTGNYLMIDCTKSNDSRFAILNTNRSADNISEIRVL